MKQTAAQRRAKRSAARKGKKGGMRKRSTNAVTGGPNTCRITETYDLGDVNINQPEEYIFDGIPPNTRAAEVAPNFGLYRIARVTYYMKPFYDTFTPGIVNSNPGNNYLTTVPRLYWKMNRYGDAPAAFDAAFLRDQGAIPLRLDDKTVKIFYKPNILLADAGAAAAGLNGGSGQVKITPWLSTDAEVNDGAFALSTTQHYGHIMYVEGNKLNNASDVVVGRIEAKVVWEFKNPRGITEPAGAPLKVTKKLGQHV